MMPQYYGGYNFQYNQPMDQLNQLRQPYQIQQNQNSDERIWVQGKESALAYLVAPNGFVRLWDSQEPVFYEKRADHTGRPTLETFEYKRKGSDLPFIESSGGQRKRDYEEDINALDKRLKAIEDMLNKEKKHEQSNADD